MNIFDVSIIDEFESCSLFYIMSPETHTESIYLYFEHMDEYEDDVIKHHYLVEKAPILSNWLTIFGYEKNEDEIFKTFKSLKNLLTIIPFEKYRSKESIRKYISTLTEDVISDQIASVWGIIKPVMEKYPLLAFIYTDYHNIFSLIKDATQYTEDYLFDIDEITSSFRKTSERILKLELLYKTTRSYCTDVFKTENSLGGTVSPQTVDYIYREYCNEADKIYYKMQPVLSSTGRIGTFRDIEGGPISLTWAEYYDFHKNSSAFDEDGTTNDIIFSLEDIAYLGISYLLESESVLRTCKLCGKEFQTKYTSTREYCTRLYGKTKAACNEYASRKSYKEKLFQHPIHQEFTKAYNRLYGRIRRGKIPEDTPLMGQLKALHDEYYKKYESAGDKKRPSVLEEYVKKNQEIVL